jgi:hypothetical protein
MMPWSALGAGLAKLLAKLVRLFTDSLRIRQIAAARVLIFRYPKSRLGTLTSYEDFL